MTDKDYNKLLNFTFVGAGWVPTNQPAQELTNITKNGETVSFLEVTNRDLKFHQAYFSLLNFIWGYMPVKFKTSIPKEKFYIFLKHLKGEFEVMFTFKDGTKMIEYESLSFGRMSQKTFQVYILNQLPWIYENVIGIYFSGKQYDDIIDTIEEAFEKFLSKL